MCDSFCWDLYYVFAEKGINLLKLDGLSLRFDYFF